MEHKKENLLDEITESKEQKKKPYVSPRLKSYGDVVKLTQGVSGVGTDMGTHQMMK